MQEGQARGPGLSIWLSGARVRGPGPGAGPAGRAWPDMAGPGAGPPRPRRQGHRGR